jgi:hypothetical protein
METKKLSKVEKTGKIQQPEIELNKIIPLSKKFIRATRVLGAVLLPILFLRGDSKQKPIVISDAVSNYQAKASEIASRLIKTEGSKESSKETAHALFKNYFTKNIPERINLENIEIINNSNSSDQDYYYSILSWEGNLPIFAFLSSKESKIRFIKTILARDDLNQSEYTTPDYGPDIDSDGIIELTYDENGNTINEVGEIVDTTSFVCSDFSRELNLRFGIQNGVPQNELKLQLPMMSVSIGEGYVSDDERQAWGRGHGFNAVYFGEDIVGFDDLSNWFFIEPQSDDDVINPFIHLVDARLLTLSIPHTDDWKTEGDSLISFFLMPDSTLQPIDDIELQIFEEIEKWCFMNEYPSLVNGEIRDDLMSDEPDLLDFEVERIYDVAVFAVNSGYLSSSQVSGALQDAYLPIGFKYSELFDRLNAIK